MSCQSTAPFCSALRSCVPVLAASDPEDTCGLKATSRSLSPLVECNLLNLAPHSRPWIWGEAVSPVSSLPQRLRQGGTEERVALGLSGLPSWPPPALPEAVRSTGSGQKI